MRPGSLRSVPIAAPSVQGKPCKARNGRWTGRPHRESPRASVSASPVIIYYNACLKTQSDRLLASQTAQATEEITQQIMNVQQATNRAVDEIRTISSVAEGA